MLKKLNVGDRFIFGLMNPNRPSSLARRVNDPPDFQIVDPRLYKLRHARANPVAASVPTASPVELGQHADPSRNFQWLPWLPGLVSFVPVPPNLPIVTGEMTGCWLALFRLGGVLCFGHIGTEGGTNAPNTTRAKQAWKIAERAGLIQPVKAFLPRATVPGADKVLGALSANHHFYTLNLMRVANAYEVKGVVRTHRDGNAPNLT